MRGHRGRADTLPQMLRGWPTLASKTASRELRADFARRLIERIE